MELLLWRWSTAVQITSDLMIAVFFLVLSRSMRRVELRPWVYAWLANLGALSVTIAFWLFQPQGAIFVASRFLYFFSKTAFVLLLVAGVYRFVAGRSARTRYGAILGVVAALAILATISGTTIDRIGLIESAVIGLGLGAGVLFILMKRPPAWGWLAAGFGARSLLALMEATASATRLHPIEALPPSVTGVFLAAASSFDTGAEWLIVLGSVLTLYGKIHEELAITNRELVGAKEELQALVDRDPLTGLANRRGLSAVLRASYETGATILFFDVNDFKIINDSYGHRAGDEALKRFARALESCFRPGDHIIRYAGDEFVVVAPAAEPADIAPRIDQARERLHFERSLGPHVRFSVGIAHLPPHGDPDAALRAADEAMYREKAKKTAARKISLA